MNERQLTGKWFLRKRKFGGFNVMVQVKSIIWIDAGSFANGGGCEKTEIIEYKKATIEGLIELNINCI